MPITPMDSTLKRNILLTVISGGAATMAVNLTNPFYSLFVIRLGGTDYHVAWLSSLPALAAMLVLIPGGAFIDRFTYKKTITCMMIGANRFFYLCLALVPFLPPLVQATTFVLIVGLMRFPGAVAEIAWQSFYADFVPDLHRGPAMARRSRTSTFVGMLVTYGAGYILSQFPQTDAERTQFYQVFFVLAFLISAIEIYTHMKIREPRHEEDEKESAALNKIPLMERFRLMMVSFNETPQAKRFLIFAICSIIFHFGWQMGWPLFSLYQIKHLHADESWLALISVISGISSMISYTPWSKFAEKVGNDKALTITGLGMAITPALYAISPNLPILAAMNVMVGISTAGFTLILFNISLKEAPKFQRTLYIACYNTIISVSGFIAPQIGAYFTELLGIHGSLFVTSFFRFVGVVAFFVRYRHHAKDAGRVREVA